MTSVYQPQDVKATTDAAATTVAAIISALETNRIALFKKSQYSPCSNEFKEWKISVIYPKSKHVPEVLYPTAKIIRTVPLHIGGGELLYKVIIDKFEGILLCSGKTLEDILNILTSKYVLRSDYDVELLQVLYSIGVLSCDPSLEHPPRVIHKRELHEKIIEEIGNILTGIGWFTLVPETVEIEITRKCNFRCIHCCRECPTNDREFDRRDIIRIIRSLGELGSANLTLTGGEPLLYEGIIDILKEAKSQYLSVTILTNGSRLSDVSFLRDIMKYVGSFQLSIYGPSAHIHDRVTGVRGSFFLLLRALENIMKHSKFRERKIIVSFNYVLIKDINDDPHILEDIMKAFSALPVKIRFTPVVPEGRGRSLPMYTSHELRIVGKHVRELAKKYQLEEKLVTGGIPGLSYPSCDALVFGCPAARDLMFIGIEGYASPCDALYNYVHVPLGEDHVLEVWLSDTFFEYKEIPEKSCPFGTFCGGPCKYDVISQSKNRQKVR